jgi:hypothetical protein
MKDRNSQSMPWRPFLSELVGTALLVLVGLSLVIVMFGSGSPVARALPSEGLRRLITGFLFGTTGALIAVSAVGRVSGAPINPVELTNSRQDAPSFNQFPQVLTLPRPANTLPLGECDAALEVELPSGV